MGGCLHSATWDEALARCNAYGARLCTLIELPVNQNSGCGHDDELVWVWNECDHSSLTPRHVAAQGGDTRFTRCADSSTQYAVRCCADEVSGLPPSPPPRVNAVAPGEIETAMLSPETEVLIPRIPLHRLGEPKDVASTIYYLCSEDSSYVTGTEIFVTGGQHLL